MTFEEPSVAFKAIESAKNDPTINMYDVGFGGRRAFCGASYADLGEYHTFIHWMEWRKSVVDRGAIELWIISADNVETEEDLYGVASTASAFTQPEESFESLLQSFKRKVAAVAP